MPYNRRGGVSRTQVSFGFFGLGCVLMFMGSRQNGSSPAVTHHRPRDYLSEAAERRESLNRESDGSQHGRVSDLLSSSAKAGDYDEKIADINPFRNRPPTQFPMIASVYRTGHDNAWFEVVLKQREGALQTIRGFVEDNTKEGIRVGAIRTEDGKEVTKDEHVRAMVFVQLNDEHWMWPALNVGRQVEAKLKGRRVGIKTLSLSPKVFYLSNFISDDECDHIMNNAKYKMTRSTIAGQGGTNDVSDVRTSSYAWLSASIDAKVTAVRQRVAELVQVDMHNAEDMQVLEYQAGQHYHPHHDFFDPAYYKQDPYTHGANRFITVFFYLTTVRHGGETIFPLAGRDALLPGEYGKCDHGLKVKPVRGDAVMWYNMVADGHMQGAIDHKSLHGGCDPHAGEVKWAANYWVRNKRWPGDF